MTVDIITMMAFEAGELNEEEIVEMLSDMLQTGTIDNESDKFRKLARKYINKDILDAEGNINYIKLRA
jgi:archaellum biogenesis protein FlaJ (TadC family)